MRYRKLLGSGKGFPANFIKVLAVVAVVALLMTVSAVSNFVSQNIITSAKPEDISRTAEDILYIVSGLIIFAFSGLIIVPVFKIALVAVAIWLIVRGLKSLKGFFLGNK